MTEREIALAAFQRTDPVERAAYLDRVCANDEALRERVEAALQSVTDPDTSSATDPSATVASPGTRNVRPPAVGLPIRSTPPATVATFGGAPESVPVRPSEPSSEDNTIVSPAPATFPRRDEGFGTVIADRYTLAEVIGSGGMGTVYRADQIEPVRRQVALKLIKVGTDSAGVLARFDAERQALALMDHPHIARVYDGGTTNSGQPYFVMELVRGVSLTTYCDQHLLPVRARLELFVSVCAAVQHAHQKGIIHRDLKPGNVLVTEIDDRPVPKVIDFGVAKATELKLTDLSLPDLGAVVGTPAYMSPEQADPSATGVDTRTDVYALGVVLYELLVGALPIDGEQLKRASILEALRLVREVEPPRPSTKLSTADARPLIAANRSTGPAELARVLRGELDWIVMKALEKDRDLRYDSVSELARDVQRYLIDEPVEARPPTAWYKARKFARRNRGPVLAAAVVVLALIGGVIGTSWGLHRALRAEELANERFAQVEQAQSETRQALADSEDARGRAEGAQKQAEQARTASEQARVKAEVARNQAAAVSDYLVNAFRRPDPATDGRQLKVVDLLDRAADQLDRDRNMSVPARARLRDALGQTFLGLGLGDSAAALLKKALADYQDELGPDAPETLGVMHQLSVALGQTSRIDEAARVGEEVLARRRSVLGPEHPDTLLTMSQLAGRYWALNRMDDAIRLAEPALAGLRKAWGPDHPELPNSITNLGRLYLDNGRTADAVKLHEEAVALQKAHKGLDHVDTILALSILGQSYSQAGRSDDAVALQRDTLAGLEQKLGPGHLRVLEAMSKLIQTYNGLGRASDALPVSETALKRARDAKPPSAAAVIRAMQDLALTYGYLNRPADALALHQDVVAKSASELGPEHGTTVTATHDLGVALIKANKAVEAVPVLERALGAEKRTRPEHDTLVQRTTSQLASAYETVGRPADAVPLLERLLVVQRSHLDPDHRDLLVAMANLGLVYTAVGRTGDAVRMHEQVVTGFKKKFGLAYPDTRTATRFLGAAYQADGQLDRAAATYRGLLAATRTLPVDDLDRARTLVGLGEVLLDTRDFSEAEKVLREGLTIREKKSPDDWKTFHTQSLLGAALAGQKRFDEAGPLLHKGYEGLTARANTIPGSQRPALAAAADRLVGLYTATTRPAEADRWRRERAKYPPPTAPLPHEK